MIWACAGRGDEKVDEICKQLDKLERRVKGLEERHVQAPSLTWLLQNRPRDTIKWGLFFLVIAFMILAFAEPLRLFIFNAFGVAP